MKWIWALFIIIVGIGYWGIFSTGIQPKSVRVIRPSFFKDYKELTGVIKRQIYARLAVQDIIILGIEDTSTMHLTLELVNEFQNINKRTVWTNFPLQKTKHSQKLINPNETSQKSFPTPQVSQDFNNQLMKPNQKSIAIHSIDYTSPQPMKKNEKRTYIVPIQKSLSFLDKTSWLPKIQHKKKPRVLSLAILKVRKEAPFLYGPCTENTFRGPGRLTCLIEKQQKRQQKKSEKYLAPDRKFTITMDQESAEDYILYLF